MSASGPRKAPSSKDNYNHDLCEFLVELAAYERNISRNIFKSNAYRAAASALAAHPSRVANGKEAGKIKGIGKKISEKIDEFLTTGTLKKLEKIRQDDTSVAITELTRVSGIGPAKARQLYDEGITTLTALRKQTELLSHHQQIGLRYIEEFEKRIPRSEVQAIEAAIKLSLSPLPQQYLVTVCGSYRRGSERSGDVDVLLTYRTRCRPDQPQGQGAANSKKRKGLSDDDATKKVKQPKAEANDTKDCKSSNSDTEDNNCISDTKECISKDSISSSSSATKESKSSSSSKDTHGHLLRSVVDTMTHDKLVTDTISLGDTKFMGVCRVPDGECHRRLDIRLLTPDQYHCGVLYFTGSDLFNKEMRTVALAAGFTLNEYSIRPVGSTGVPGEPLPVASEQDVFDYIGMKYKRPADRNV